MLPQPRVQVLPLDKDRATPFGPGVIEHRTAQAGFTELGTYILTFPEGGHADPWTVHYEESIFVVAGEASLLVADDAGETELRASAGELIALPNGSTVRYGGAPGTELVLSIAPVNWRDLEAVDEDNVDRARRVLFLTPFHFGEQRHDDEFDTVVTGLLAPAIDAVVVADHVDYFETDDVDYEAAQTEAVVAAVEHANDEGFDALVIACHYDPAITEARAVSRVPVVAPLQLTSGIAAQYGPKFAVITDVEEAEPVIADLVAAYGHSEACTGVTAIGWDGDTILEDTFGAAKAVDELVGILAAEGVVQSVVIGCTIVSAAYETHRHEFPDRGVVVLNSNLLTLKAAAALAAN